ncbi:MAG: parallel beta-helix domain-containing protein [Chitinophagales bacterium]
MKKILIFTLLSCVYIFSVQAQSDYQKELQTQFILAKDGEIITLKAGTFHFTRSLSLEGKKDITIQGEGMEKTVLNFKGQQDGAEGITINNCQNITIQNLTVQDTKGDGIKTMNVERIHFLRVKAEWTGKPNKNNGAYGLYPVSCNKVLIDGCVAVGASDAGIYVGQSNHIIVRNSKAYHNVAGIEIENSTMADVYNNESYNNTGGILVFDLPDLQQKKGGNVRVFNNIIRENNLPNFAPKGNIVASVPDGTGVMILATNNVEIFDNKIENNKTLGISIVSYFMTENPINDKEYYPYPTGIYIHSNEFERKPMKATKKGRLGKLFWLKLRFGKDVPDIVYDGIVDPNTQDENGNIETKYQICIRNNKNAEFINIDAENGFKNKSRDILPHDCERVALKKAEF